MKLICIDDNWVGPDGKRYPYAGPVKGEVCEAVGERIINDECSYWGLAGYQHFYKKSHFRPYDRSEEPGMETLRKILEPTKTMEPAL